MIALRFACAVVGCFWIGIALHDAHTLGRRAAILPAAVAALLFTVALI